MSGQYLARRVRHILRTVPGPSERYQLLHGVLWDCLDDATPPEERQCLRATVIELLEAHHLERMHEELRRCVVSSADDPADNCSGFLLDIFQLVGLWVYASGGIPADAFSDVPRDGEPHELLDEHPLYDPNSDTEEVHVEEGEGD